MRSKQLYSVRILFTLVLGFALVIPLSYSAPLPMDWKRPKQTDIAAGKWKIKQLASGGHKGIIRVRVKDLNPGEQFVLRVTVTNQGSSEESMIDTPSLTTEVETIAKKEDRDEKIPS